MAQLTGLFRRGSAYYIKVVLPKNHPLSGRYRNGRLVQSLGVRTYREAVRMGTLKRAEILWGVSPLPAEAEGSCPAQPAPTITFAQPAEPKCSGPRLTLRAVYERWKVAKVRSEDSEAAVALFEECLGQDVDLTKLTRAQGDEFRAWLLTKNATSKTTRDRFTWIKSLLKYAVRDLEALPRSPWEGLDVVSKTTARRRPWNPAEIQLLFSHPLFTRYELPTVQQAGRDAAYWVPLLGLYTGARISELAQLRVRDIDTRGTVPLLKITDEGEGQKVKSEAGVRTLPVHPELIRLGFLEYVQAIRRTGAVSLWPALKLREGRPGGYLSAWFGEFRRAAGLTETYPDFHCFRHTVRTIMARAGVSAEVQDSITGHEVQGSIGTKVYRHVGEEEMAAAVGCIQYPGLSMPRVYSTDPPIRSHFPLSGQQ